MKRAELESAPTLTQLPETVLHACFRCAAVLRQSNLRPGSTREGRGASLLPLPRARRSPTSAPPRSHCLLQPAVRPRPGGPLASGELF